MPSDTFTKFAGQRYMAPINEQTGERGDVIDPDKYDDRADELLEQYGTLEAVNPHLICETTTVEITKELADWLADQFGGENYTQRIGKLEWRKYCSRNGCDEVATHSNFIRDSNDDPFSIPLCAEHLDNGFEHNTTHMPVEQDDD